MGLGLGGVVRRHRKVLRDNITGITKPALIRLAHRARVKRRSGLLYEEMRHVMKLFLDRIIQCAITYCEHARRRTVTASDVAFALATHGRALVTLMSPAHARQSTRYYEAGAAACAEDGHGDEEMFDDLDDELDAADEDDEDDE